MLKLLIPSDNGIYRIAASAFVELYSKITGVIPPVITISESDCDLVILGSDAVNSFTHQMIMENVISCFDIRSGSDDYQIKSVIQNDRNLLFLASGRSRSLLYAVYDFFERRCGCRWFWDGDIIPQQSTVDLTGLDIIEKARFEYRGLRYFAHRSLNRFQAEHWGWEEWKQELDWIIKKRLNIFMLRIGLDDLFQKAFPDIVPYPEYGQKLPEAKERGYDDRNLFWSLEYRGKLRKKILQYAFARDLLSPEDTGTMSHWYSRTPQCFLDSVKPDFLPQASNDYSESTGLVWDIRQEKYLDDYFKLTEAHIKHYGKAQIFHTIGVAERKCYVDRTDNHKLKLYAYRRIIAKLREKYPDAPLLLGTWDFLMYWTPQEVHDLVKELDARNTLFFDYTSDSFDEINNFTNWGVVRKFPWIFGIFHAFEPANDIRGNYSLIERRLQIAINDPMCKGMMMWAENSHADTLMLEYFAANSWNPAKISITDFLPYFCHSRYVSRAPEMIAIWQAMLPVIQCHYWRMNQVIPSREIFNELFFAPISKGGYSVFSIDMLEKHQYYANLTRPVLSNAIQAIQMIAEINYNSTDIFQQRDLIDLVRTALSRIMIHSFSQMVLEMENWRNENTKSDIVLRLVDNSTELLRLLGELLAVHEDYSLFESLTMLRAKHKTNPSFEYTLKGNAENMYCRSYIYELVIAVYLPEQKVLQSWIHDKINSEDKSPWRRPDTFDDDARKISDRFYQEPLAIFAPDHTDARLRLSATLDSIIQLADNLKSLFES
jgi:Alpha-N-acetylglucosaminidase (NAGLU) tim-barrel domain